MAALFFLGDFGLLCCKGKDKTVKSGLSFDFYMLVSLREGAMAGQAGQISVKKGRISFK